MRKSSSDLIFSDVVSIKKLLIQLQVDENFSATATVISPEMQGLLSQEELSAQQRMEEENRELRRELSVLRLKVAERDRRIEMLERRLEYGQSRSLYNIATQTQNSGGGALGGNKARPRPLSWDLTSINLVRNINRL